MTPDDVTTLIDRLERIARDGVQLTGYVRTLMNDCALTMRRMLDRERWIPVTERLPEEPGAYLCVIIYRHGRYRAVATWRGKTWEIDRRVDLDDTVTHWSPLRPLPEPPEKP